MKSQALHQFKLCRAEDEAEQGGDTSRRESDTGDSSRETTEADTSGEQLILALQTLHKHSNPEVEPESKEQRPTPPEPVLARISYPKVDIAQVAQGRKRLGGLAGGPSRKTRLEQEISLATSKVLSPPH